jgi:hypothetical protein
VSTSKKINDWLLANEESTILFDGLDDALLGLTYDTHVGSWRAIYSTELCLTICMERDGMSYDEAVEFFQYNISGGYHGSQTPLFIDESII